MTNQRDEHLDLPTDDERERIGRAGLNAAWLTLQPLRNSELSLTQGTFACIRAFEAAEKAMFKAREELKTAHHAHRRPGMFEPHSSTEVVCSALAFLDCNTEELEKVAPRSFWGCRIAMLLKAAKIIETSEMFDKAMNSDNFDVTATDWAGMAAHRAEEEMDQKYGQ